MVSGVISKKSNFAMAKNSKMGKKIRHCRPSTPSFRYHQKILLSRWRNVIAILDSCHLRYIVCVGNTFMVKYFRHSKPMSEIQNGDRNDIPHNSFFLLYF
jgi:hypothetical protein